MSEIERDLGKEREWEGMLREGGRERDRDRERERRWRREREGGG